MIEQDVCKYLVGGLVAQLNIFKGAVIILTIVLLYKGWIYFVNKKYGEK